MRISMKNNVYSLVFPLFVLLFTYGCGGGGSSGGGSAEGAAIPGNGSEISLASVQLAIAEAISAGDVDTDGDGIPDTVELNLLHTDKDLPDSDRDGIFDYEEIFGTGIRRAASRLPAAAGLALAGNVPDKDGDGLIAAIDADDNNDGIHDGELVDSDGDGIPNYLELYGYTYNALLGTFNKWNDDYTKTYYKTDPNQKSTDQDPFSDSVEVSGVNMDVAIREPGNLPMVPAMPEIVVRLEGYRVTLNQTITYAEGKTLGEGTSWERSSSASDSHTSESKWEVGVEREAELGTKGKVSVKFHVNHGWGTSDTVATSTSRSTGGSSTSEVQWSKAYTENPTQAAKIKLFLKIYNQGTAVASTVAPTLTLRVGGHNIATFEPGNATVNLIEPGGVYPSAPGVYWVVDSIDTGTGVSDIFLTLNELKALESGAPVSISMTQMSADVMMKNTSTGAYENMGAWNEYMARCKAVSASIFFDIGDGNFVRQMVYAGKGPFSPQVKLGDAFVWAVGGYPGRGSSGSGFTYRDFRDGSLKSVDLAGWSICVDGATLLANGYAKGQTLPANLNPFALVLNPGSVIVAKAPRGSTLIGPEIHYAYYDSSTNHVSAIATDYNGITAVEFIDKDGHNRTMSPDMNGSDFYDYSPAADTKSYPNGYEFNGQEKIRVTNVNGESVEQTLTGVYVPPILASASPTIEYVFVDVGSRIVEAKVTQNTYYPAEWVRVYHPLLVGGYMSMELVADSYKRPGTYSCTLPPTFPTDPMNAINNLLVVAYVQENVFAEKGPSTLRRPLRVGTAVLDTKFDYYFEDEWWMTAIDIDAAGQNIFTFHTDYWVPPPYAPSVFIGPYDFWVSLADGNVCELHFQRAPSPTIKHARVTEDISYDDVSYSFANAYPLQDSVGRYGVSEGDIFIMETTAGKRAKMEITSRVGYDPATCCNNGTYVSVRYMVYE